MKNSRIVIDASFFLKLFLPEENSDKAEVLWRKWIEDSTEIVSPTLIVFETVSVLRNKVFRGILADDDAKEIIQQVKDFDLSLVYTEDIVDIVWEVGKELNAPVLYDCYYLAVSKFLSAPLWTADEKFYSSAKKKYPVINLL
ncbi:MAG: type II toxin-antitoxin system VapC family toxin [Nitrospirae bacterium]|nr:type II toxin-antitoxin system VapC family toxin [Nitrospirota bacterium]